MSRFRRFQVVERRSPAYFLEETTTAIFTPPKTLFPNYPCFPAFPIFEHDLEFPHSAPFFFDEVDTLTDLIQIERAPLRRVTRRIGLGLGLGELQLLALSDRVSDLELGLKRLLLEEKARKKKTKKVEEKKYSWTAEIETAEKHRKYNWTTEIKGGDDEKKSYKWTAQIKGKGVPNERTYTVDVSSGRECAKGEKKKEVKENGKSAARIVEIEQPSDHGAIVLRKAFTKRLEKKKGKSKELSPQDAAALIQMSFRAYLIRRSQALRALRELAIAKTKLKEIRALFNNFSYRRRLSRDAEERQRFSEKIIVLLLTVDAIEGSDSMVRGARRCMVDELEAMLDVVDPQPPGKSRRTTFDMPDGVINKEVADGVINKEVADGVINKEVAAGVAKIIEMLHALIGDESNGA